MPETHKIRPEPNSLPEAEPSRLLFSSFSEASPLHPKRNEDHFFIDTDQRVFAVFDGMGGHFGGDIASATAANALQKELSKVNLHAMTQNKRQEYFKKLMEKLDNAVFQEGKRHKKKSKGKMGTTGVIAHIVNNPDGTREVLAASVGDSRVYVCLQEAGLFGQLTMDDGVLSESSMSEDEHRQLEAKLSNVITQEDYDRLDNTEKFLFNHKSSITQYLGMGFVEVNMYKFPLKVGDRIAVVSDGISDNLSNREIAHFLRTLSIDDALTAIQELAKERMGQNLPASKPDDATIIIIGV